MIISLTKLAYWTFQSCRHGREDAAALLDVLAALLEVAKKGGVLRTTLTEDQLKRLPAYVLADIEVGAGTTAAPKTTELDETRLQLLSLIEVGTKELIRLEALKSVKAMRSLGYALHIIPNLIVGSQPFDPKLYKYSFRVAAYSWSKYSREMQEALCRTAGLDRNDASARVEQDGYVVDLGVS